MHLSFSGIITFKNASEVREAAALCPIDRLLVETDSPFLAPIPHRGRTADSTGEEIASVLVNRGFGGTPVGSGALPLVTLAA